MGWAEREVPEFSVKNRVIRRQRLPGEMRQRLREWTGLRVGKTRDSYTDYKVSVWKPSEEGPTLFPSPGLLWGRSRLCQGGVLGSFPQGDRRSKALCPKLNGVDFP